jgi:cardiolipin synthase
MFAYIFSAAGLSLLLSVMTTYHILRYRHRESVSAVLWIFIAFSFPLVGPVLYFLFGINRVKMKGLRLEAARNHLLQDPGQHVGRALQRRAENMRRYDTGKSFVEAMPATKALDRQLHDMPALVNNRIRLLRDGDEAYPAMLEAIDEARSSIHLETYIIRPDRIGRRFMDLLSRKARQGVPVRFLYDRLGSSAAHLSGFFLEYETVPNLQIQGYTLVHPLKRRMQINLRNHRKLLVVDGHTGFLGGINLHDENLSEPGKESSIHDYHVEVLGPAVCELQFTFLQDWYHTSEENPEALLREEYFPPLDPRGEAFARVVRSGPGHDYEAIHGVFFTFLVMAQRSIRLLTPYFVPDAPLFTALVNAAARGVDVRVIVPQKNNHWYIHYATRSFYAPLLEAGVRMFERPPPFVHAKALLVDNQWAFVGSSNFDIRSFRLNFELNLEARGPFAEQLRQVLQEEILCSEEIELEDFEKRRRWEPLLENLCALASPML